MTKLLLLIGIIPVVAATAIAGTISNPSKVRPCAVEFSKGITGQPTHMILGPEGDIYAAEDAQSKILRFNPDTHVAREYQLKHTVHDLTLGPDGRIWFVSAPAFDNKKDTGFPKLGALDPKTGKVQLYPGITRNAEPHMLRWDRGKLYITEYAAGKLAIFDPTTKKITEGFYGLPRNSVPHNIAVLPNGNFWVVLQQGNALARFNLRKQRFDKFVRMPIPNSGPRDITFVKRPRPALFATLFAANKLAEYDLSTGKLTLHDVGIAPISYAVALSRQPKPKLTFVRPDASGKFLWIATLAGGELLRFDLATDKVKPVGCGLKIISGPLGMVSDRKGRFWVAITFTSTPNRGRIALIEE